MPSAMPSIVAATTAALLLGGCAGLQDRVDDVLGGDLETFEFDCDNDRDIRIAFLEDGEEARLFSGSDSVDLRLVEDRDDDVRIYENDDGTVRMVDQGDRVDVSVDEKENFEACEPEDRDYRGGGGAF